MRSKDSRRGRGFQPAIDALRAASLTAGALLAAALLASITASSTGASAGTSGRAGVPPVDSLRITPVGRRDFVARENPDKTLLPEGLSAILWLGGDDYLSVGDEHPCLHPLTIRVDPDSGRILTATFGAPIRLTDSLGIRFPEDTMGKDREGIAPGPTSESVWLANEWTGADIHKPSLELHSMEDGRMLRLVRTDGDSILSVFSRIRYNLGFESLCKTPDGSAYWTGNEGPLQMDGRRPSDSTDAVVRLIRFDGAMRPLAEYPYRIDAYAKRIASPFFLVGNEANGLSDLVALPGGRLLALERSFAGDANGAANFRHRIYVVDPAGATDVSGSGFADGLVGKDYTAARKRLLWQMNSGFTNSNFEGMCLGPRLRNGDRVILLIADNDQGRSEALYSLRLSGLP
ncbi:MAG: esterase-like activity of phytase family protein [Candidatus Eiseniibacteriota bacterium]